MLPPKNTRDSRVARYRYNVKSYHSTMVEKAAMITLARGRLVAGPLISVCVIPIRYCPSAAV